MRKPVKNIIAYMGIGVYYAAPVALYIGGYPDLALGLVFVILFSFLIGRSL